MEADYGIRRPTIYRLACRGGPAIHRRAGERKSYVEGERVEELVRFRPRAFESK